jgi:AhpD family alkylhydroperoxidase
MTSARETLADVAQAGRRLREKIPEVYAAYSAEHKAAVGRDDGALEAKMRELIALAIAVSKQCDGCIASHARGAVSRGATAEEVAEAIGVAILMNGGPGPGWGARAYAAYEEYASASH